MTGAEAGGDADLIYAGGVRHRSHLGAYLGWGALSLVLIGLPMLLWRWLTVRAERWRIDTQRIERTRGVLTRRTDSLELWRVRDLAHEATLWDRLLGDGRIVLFSADATDPVLVLRGLPGHRRIYERLRDAVEAARRRQRLIEQV